MTYLGIDNKTKEYELMFWTGTVKELTEIYPDVIWYSSFKNTEEVDFFINTIIKQDKIGEVWR